MKYRQQGGEVEESAAHHREEARTIKSLKHMQGSEDHTGREKKAINKLARLEREEKIEPRRHGGPVSGARKLYDKGPRYPKQAGGYVR